MFQQEVVGGTVAGEAAGADQLDLEAAEQLIQLSGGDGDDDGGSESRSADSVKCCGDNQAGLKEEKEAAVESHLRISSHGRFAAGKDGGGGDTDMRSGDSVNSNNKCSRAPGAEVKGKEEEPAVESRRRSAALPGVVDDGKERRRPRFRWLADIYRETRQLMTRDLQAAVGDDPLEADERRRKRKRSADTGDEDVVVPVVSKQSKKRTMAA